VGDRGRAAPTPAAIRRRSRQPSLRLSHGGPEDGAEDDEHAAHDGGDDLVGLAPGREAAAGGAAGLGEREPTDGGRLKRGADGEADGGSLKPAGIVAGTSMHGGSVEAPCGAVMRLQTFGSKRKTVDQGSFGNAEAEPTARGPRTEMRALLG